MPPLATRYAISHRSTTAGGARTAWKAAGNSGQMNLMAVAAIKLTVRTTLTAMGYRADAVVLHVQHQRHQPPRVPRAARAGQRTRCGGRSLEQQVDRDHPAGYGEVDDCPSGGVPVEAAQQQVQRATDKRDNGSQCDVVDGLYLHTPRCGGRDARDPDAEPSSHSRDGDGNDDEQMGTAR